MKNLFIFFHLGLLSAKDMAHERHDECSFQLPPKLLTLAVSKIFCRRRFLHVQYLFLARTANWRKTSGLCKFCTYPHDYLHNSSKDFYGHNFFSSCSNKTCCLTVLDCLWPIDMLWPSLR